MDHAVDIIQNASDVGRSMSVGARRQPGFSRYESGGRPPQDVHGHVLRTVSVGGREVDASDCEAEERRKEEEQELISRRLDVESGFWSVVTSGWLGQAFCIFKSRTPLRALQYRRRRMVPLEWPLVICQLAGILAWTVMMVAEDYGCTTKYGCVPWTLRAVILAQWMHSQSVLAMIFVVVSDRRGGVHQLRMAITHVFR